MPLRNLAAMRTPTPYSAAQWSIRREETGIARRLAGGWITQIGRNTRDPPYLEGGSSELFIN
ncbi:MAG TPA: hypothetical protein GXZ82_03300 [Firmicutes bacterium]|jgi:hypothetical protein|nr:hypothetical protein [Bacillota bacterium]